jgi:ribosomal protein L25 (general stress protein Ctc)
MGKMDNDFDPVQFESLTVLANKIRCFSSLGISNTRSKKDAVKKIKYLNTKEGQDSQEVVMPLIRAKKIILDYYKKKADDSSYEVNHNDFENMVSKMSSEMQTVISIKMASDGLLDMAWDDEIQDFVFKKGEEDGSSNEKK